MQDRIMLVQDDQELFHQLKQAYSDLEETLLWSNGDGEVLEVFQSSNVQVLILDLDLRDGTAWNTLADLITLDPHVRVILLSSSPGWHSLAVSVGADLILDKPVDVVALVRQLKEYCSQPEHHNRLCADRDPEPVSQSRLVDTNLLYLQWIKERRRSARDVSSRLSCRSQSGECEVRNK